MKLVPGCKETAKGEKEKRGGGDENWEKQDYQETEVGNKTNKSLTCWAQVEKDHQLDKNKEK